MSFNYSFVSVEDKKRADALIKFLAYQDLGYPRFDEWREKVRWQIIQGDKKAILALSNGVIVGDGVYQRHKTLPGVIEVKNVRILPDFGLRGFARFVFRQIELDALEMEAYGLIGDVREDQVETRAALRNMGFREVAGLSLYDSSCLDVVIFKNLGANGSNSNIYSTTK